MTVVVGDVVFDGPNEVRHTAKGAPTNPLACDLGEPALD